MNIQQIIKENEEEFDKKFGVQRELDGEENWTYIHTKDLIQYPQPKDIKQFLNDSQLYLLSAFKEMVEEKLTPPEKWKKSLKAYNGNEQLCALCGFNPEELKKDLLSSLTQETK